MRQSRSSFLPLAAIARQRNAVRQIALCLAVAILVISRSAVAQEASPPPVCQMTTSFDAAPDLNSFSAHSWQFSVSCSGTVIRFYSARVGVTITGPGGYRDSFTSSVGFDSHTSDAPAEQSVTGTTNLPAARMRCLAPGSYAFTSGAAVDYVGFLPYDSATSCHGNCPLTVGVAGTPGSFAINAEDSVVTLRAELAQPPVGANNVRVNYKFGANSGDPAWQVDSGPLSRIGSFAGELLLKLPAGHHTFTAFSCGGLRAAAEIDVPAAEQPGVFTFDLPASDDIKVLAHRYGDETAPVNDPYPSSLQSAPHEIKVQGTIRDAAGLPLTGRRVYFRATDPPDTSTYVPSNAQTAGDNADGPGRINGRAANVTAVSDPAGRVSITLNTTDHAGGDNYQIEASTNPDFSCAGGCPKSAVYTAWKRVYFEESMMFRRGSHVSLSTPSEAGTAEIWVDDTRPFRSGQTVRLIHGPRFEQPAAVPTGVPGFDVLDPLGLFYEEDHLIDVIPVATNAQGQTVPAHLRLQGTDVLNHTYLADRSFVRRAEDKPVLILADFVGVVGSGRDFYRADPSLLGPLYADAFVEYVATTSPVPELPLEPIMPATQWAWLGNKWFFNAVRPGAGVMVRALPNHQHLLGAAETEPGLAPPQNGLPAQPGTRLGDTIADHGSNLSYVWVGRIERAVREPQQLIFGASATLATQETTVHELTHQWHTNRGFPGEHCTEDRYQHDGLWCLMHQPAQGQDRRNARNTADGLVSLHYRVGPGGVVDSEYRTIRLTPEPIPLQ